MKRIAILACVVGFCCSAMISHAIDRDAKMIDTLGCELAFFDDAERILLSLWGETVFAVPTEDWSVLVGGGIGSIAPDNLNDEVDFWTVGIGLKYYVTPLTSVFAIGDYSAYDQEDDPDLTSGTLGVKHRFISADDGVSPFMTLSVTGQSGDRLKETVLRGYRFPELIVSIGAGCYFMLTDSLALVFQGGGFRAEEDISESSSIGTGWGGMGSIAIVGYWE